MSELLKFPPADNITKMDLYLERTGPSTWRIKAAEDGKEDHPAIFVIMSRTRLLEACDAVKDKTGVAHVRFSWPTNAGFIYPLARKDFDSLRNTVKGAR